MKRTYTLSVHREFSPPLLGQLTIFVFLILGPLGLFLAIVGGLVRGNSPLGLFSLVALTLLFFILLIGTAVFGIHWISMKVILTATSIRIDSIVKKTEILFADITTIKTITSKNGVSLWMKTYEGKNFSIPYNFSENQLADIKVALLQKCQNAVDQPPTYPS